LSPGTAMHVCLAPMYVRVLAVKAMADAEREAALLQCAVEEMGVMWVPGEPVPAARTGGNGKRRFKDAKTARYQQAVCDAAVAAALPRVGIADDEAAIVVAHLFCSRSNARERAKVRAERIADESGPDVDNVAKSLLDGMQLHHIEKATIDGLMMTGGPMRDDRRVCSMTIRRHLAGSWCGPGALVVLARVRVLDR
jgi:Holliday junction resolvase RusA-like endonuclease